MIYSDVITFGILVHICYDTLDEPCIISMNNMSCTCIVRNPCHKKYGSMTCIITMYHDLKCGISFMLYITSMS